MQAQPFHDRARIGRWTEEVLHGADHECRVRDQATVRNDERSAILPCAPILQAEMHADQIVADGLEPPHGRVNNFRQFPHGCYFPRRTGIASADVSGLRDYLPTHQEELARSFVAAALPNNYWCSVLEQSRVRKRALVHLHRTSTTHSVTAICSAFAGSAPASLFPQPPNEAGAINPELLPRAGKAAVASFSSPGQAAAATNSESPLGSQAVASVSCEHVDAAATATTLSRMKKARTFEARTSIASTDSSYSIAA